MPIFRWLHLTDLHAGLAGMATLLPAVKAALRQDLVLLRSQMGGPIDLVLFTGDLSQRGDAVELDGVSGLLGDLLAPLGADGPPPLLAIPGNHDLVRPAASVSTQAFLRSGEEDSAYTDIWAEFWSRPDHEWRRLIEQAFAPYTAWARRCSLRRPDGAHPGLLPGEVFVTLEKEGARIGLCGLNSAARQLAGGDFEGRLLAHPAQLHAAPGGDGVAWAQRHHAALLLSHHPPSWLGATSRAHFEGELLPYFQLHLCGHLHDGLATVAGWQAQSRRWQAPSLFGLERDAKGVQRAHGYTGGWLEISEGGGRLRLFPRVGVRPQGGNPWRIAPDVAGGLVLQPDGGTAPVAVALHQPFAPRPAITRPPPPHPPAQVPELRDWTLRQLEQRGSAVIYGPTGFGKTLLATAVLAEGAARHGWHTGRLDLSHMPTLTLLSDPSVFFRRLGRLVAEIDGINLAEVWRRRWIEEHTEVSPVDILSSFLTDEVAKAAGGRTLVVSIEHIELLEANLRGQLLSALRAQLEFERRTLGLILGSSWPSWAWDSLPSGSPFNVTLPRELPGLPLRAVEAMAAQLGVVASPAECKALRDSLDGHPGLLHAILTEAAGQRLPDPAQSGAFWTWIERVELAVERAGHREALVALAQGEEHVELPQAQLLALYAHGLVKLWVVRGRTRASFASPLLRQHFSGPRPTPPLDEATTDRSTPFRRRL